MKEKKLRRLLNHNGYELRKGRPAVNVEGYMIVDSRLNACVAGSGYTMTLDDVRQWVNDNT